MTTPQASSEAEEPGQPVVLLPESEHGRQTLLSGVVSHTAATCSTQDAPRRLQPQLRCVGWG
jgi:hypothetical protein